MDIPIHHPDEIKATNISLGKQPHTDKHRRFFLSVSFHFSWERLLAAKRIRLKGKTTSSSIGQSET
jgi:hypothetical protein